MLFISVLLLAASGCDMSHLEPEAMQQKMREPAYTNIWQTEARFVFIQDLGKIAPGVEINRMIVKRIEDGAEFGVLASSDLEFTFGETVTLVETSHHLNPFVQNQSFFIKGN